MNSLLKQDPSSQVETPESYVDSFEKKLLSLQSLSEVELIMTKLKFLGVNFDPFSGDVTSECGQVMESLAIKEHLKNPYLATNILLRLLDKTEERLNNLKQ